MRINDSVMEMLVRETVRIIDTVASKSDYLFDECPQYRVLIDKEASKVRQDSTCIE